jgi:isopenicillin-N epimerase
MDISTLFATEPGLAFLNAGSLCRTPLEVLEAMIQLRREGEQNPTIDVFRGPSRLWEAQVRLAPFLGADPQDLFLRPNITSALNDFLFGLEPERGEVLVTGMEYGATVNLSRLMALQRGMEFRSVPLPLGPEITAPELESAVTSAFSPATKLLVVSHVVTGTGTILPVAAIASAARKKGIVVVVDGAHAVGALPLQLEAIGADFYGGNFHKWFMGPRGTAFGWVHPRWKGRIRWKFGGWASFGPSAAFAGFGGDEECARRVFPGTMDTTPFQVLPQVLEFWERHGIEALRSRQAALRDLAATEAEALGWVRASPRDPSLLGPLVAFERPTDWPEGSVVEQATRIFKECRVQLLLPQVQGKTLVRLSPGVYSTEKEVREGVARLGRFGK